MIAFELKRTDMSNATNANNQGGIGIRGDSSASDKHDDGQWQWQPSVQPIVTIPAKNEHASRNHGQLTIQQSSLVVFQSTVQWPPLQVSDDAR